MLFDNKCVLLFVCTVGLLSLGFLKLQAFVFVVPKSKEKKLQTQELFLKSPCLHPLFGPAFTPLSPPPPSFSGFRKVTECYLIKSQYEMLKLII
jgi:hypothetical protein